MDRITMKYDLNDFVETPWNIVIHFLSSLSPILGEKNKNNPQLMWYFIHNI